MKRHAKACHLRSVDHIRTLFLELKFGSELNGERRTGSEWRDCRMGFSSGYSGGAVQQAHTSVQSYSVHYWETLSEHSKHSLFPSMCTSELVFISNLGYLLGATVSVQHCAKWKLFVQSWRAEGRQQLCHDRSSWLMLEISRHDGLQLPGLRVKHSYSLPGILTL